MRKSKWLIMSIVVIISCQTSNTEKKFSPVSQETIKKDKPVNTAEAKPVNKEDLKTEVFAKGITKKESTQYRPSPLQNESTDYRVVEKNEAAIKQLLATLNVRKQTFTVATDRITTIKAEKGATFKINPADLVTGDGKFVSGEISIVLKEYPNKLDMLKANAQTVSNGQLLVSGGSYYIEMTAGDLPLQLKEGKTLEAWFPGMNQQGMEIFYGSKDDNGTMNWVKPADAVLATARSLSEEQKDWVKENKFQDDSYYFRTFKLVIKKDELELYAGKAAANGQIKRNKFNISGGSREWMQHQIEKARISYASYQNDEIAGYYFHTDECEIYLEAAAVVATSNQLTTDEMKKLKEQVDWYLKQTRARLEQEQLNSRITSSSRLKKLGWINCDRFYQDTSARKNFIVTLRYPGEATASSACVFMIFKNINSLLNGNYDAETVYSFRNVPSRSEVCLVAFTTLNGKLYAAKTGYFDLSQQSTWEIKLREIAATELDPLINSL